MTLEDLDPDNIKKKAVELESLLGDFQEKILKIFSFYLFLFKNRVFLVHLRTELRVSAE